MKQKILCDLSRLPKSFKLEYEQVKASKYAYVLGQVLDKFNEHGARVAPEKQDIPACLPHTKPLREAIGKWHGYKTK